MTEYIKLSHFTNGEATVEADHDLDWFGVLNVPENATTLTADEMRSIASALRKQAKEVDRLNGASNG